MKYSKEFECWWGEFRKNHTGVSIVDMGFKRFASIVWEAALKIMK